MTLAIINFLIFFIWTVGVQVLDNSLFWAVGDILWLKYAYFQQDSVMLYTIFTHMYLHGGILHIISNMVFLVLLGFPFEERIGAKWFVIIYFIAGAFGSIIDAGFSLYNYSTPFGQFLGTDPAVPHIGASGAIFGILGAFVVLYPRDKVFLPVGVIAMHVPVWGAALAYGAIESILAFANPNDHIGHMVHIMGFLSGAALAVMFSKHIKSDERAKIEDRINYIELKKLAQGRELRELFLKIKDEDEPDIRKAWLEEYVERASCPECKADLKLKGRKIKCKQCNYSLKI